MSWSDPLPSRKLVSRGGDHAARADPRVAVELAGPSPRTMKTSRVERMSSSYTHPRFPWRNDGIPCPRDRVSGLTGPGGRVFIKIGRYPSVRPMRPKTQCPGGRRSVTEMKNLLGIIGSPRKMGNCELMVKEIAGQACPSGRSSRWCASSKRTSVPARRATGA